MGYSSLWSARTEVAPASPCVSRTRLPLVAAQRCAATVLAYLCMCEEPLPIRGREIDEDKISNA